MKTKEIIQKYQHLAKIPGISVSLINEDNSMEFLNYGHVEKDSGVKPTENTIFEIASVSKTFTSSLLSILQRENMLKLDDPITKFIPEFGPEFDKITLYHLATHTSGFPNLPTRVIVSNMMGLMSMSAKTYGSLSRFSKDDLIGFLTRSKPKTIPGKMWNYSNCAVGLLGHIFEKVTHSKYNRLVQNKICRILDMKDTGTDLFESHKDTIATGHSYFGKKTDHWIAPSIEGAAGLCSTAADLTKFLKANLNLTETAISSDLRYCQITRRFKPNMSYLMKNIMMPYVGVKFDEMALGWWVYKRKDDEILFHDGGTSGFSSFIGINPMTKTGVVVLANKTSRLVHKLGMELILENGK